MPYKCLVFHHDGSFNDCVPLDIFPYSWYHHAEEGCMDKGADFYIENYAQGRDVNWWDIDVEEDYNIQFKPITYREFRE